MSFLRLIYWSSLIGGWCAFFGWLLPEIVFGRYIDRDSVNGFLRAFLAVLMATIVAIPIGGGISLVSAFANPHWLHLLKRFGIGMAGGLAGGLIGSTLGMCVFGTVEKVTILAFLGRVIGWILIGVGIGAGMGVSEGIFDRSMNKMRNGLIGGGIGGFLGGFFFVPIIYIMTPMAARAFAFVLLGLSIGLFIGLAQVILKEAWLTVEQGFRPGRQLILTQNEITMGTSEKASLIFIAFGAKGVEPIHLRITKDKDGPYMLHDNQSRTGTLLNGAPITQPTPLRDGDTIQFGVNVVRFNERVRHAADKAQIPGAAPAPMQQPTPIPAGALSAAPVSKPVPTPIPAIQAVAPKPAPSPAITAAPPAPAPKPAPTPVAPAKPQEGRCPICDKKVVGIPGQRRCTGCFTTF